MVFSFEFHGFHGFFWAKNPEVFPADPQGTPRRRTPTWRMTPRTAARCEPSMAGEMVVGYPGEPPGEVGWRGRYDV